MNIEALAREAFDVVVDGRGRETFSADGYGISRFATLIREAVVQELVAGSGEPSEASEFMSYSKVYSADQLAGAVARERERCAKVFEAEADTWGHGMPLGAAKRRGAAAIRGQHE